MTDASGQDLQNSKPGSGERWFDDVRIVDQECVEISVTTSHGEKIYYRILRRTLFSNVDESASAAA